MTTKKKAQMRLAGKVDEAGLGELAGLIAAVLTHPLTPEAVYDGIVDGINRCDTTTDVHRNPAYLKAILIEHAKGEAENER